MAFERFKREIKEMDINQLNGELQKRKQLMFKWNNPRERTLDVKGTTPEGNMRTFSKHPFYKIRKEIAIINTFIYQIQLRRLQHEQR